MFSDLYERCVAQGVEGLCSHESDLYIPVNEVTDSLISQYEFKSIVTRFLNQVTKTMYYDVPFAFTPFWENKQKTY